MPARIGSGDRRAARDKQEQDYQQTFIISSAYASALGFLVTGPAELSMWLTWPYLQIASRNRGLADFHPEVGSKVH